MTIDEVLGTSPQPEPDQTTKTSVDEYPATGAIDISHFDELLGSLWRAIQHIENDRTHLRRALAEQHRTHACTSAPHTSRPIMDWDD
jgi:hypothetical protein